MSRNSVCSIILIAIILFGCILVGNVSFANASTPVNGLIKTNTIWTKANSPYELAGPVGVISGVTLTIEPGTIVDLKNNYILINGTIIAKGTTVDPITFNNGYLEFSSVSTGWSDPISQGSILEHIIISQINTYKASPKIASSTLQFIQINGGAPIVENNIFSDTAYIKDSSALITGNTIPNKVSVNLRYGELKLVNNKIAKGINLDGSLGAVNGTAIIANNTIGASEGKAIDVSHTHAEITGNYINGYIVVESGGQIIGDSTASATISNNVISGAIHHSGSSGSIENNLIRDVGEGSAISITNNASVSNNTITNCDICITVSGDREKAPTIAYNNFVGYKTNSIHWANSKDGDAKNNWWGTTDSNAISQSIYDGKNNFNLGTVNFTPFLTQENPQATPYIDPNGQMIQTQSDDYYIEVALPSAFIIIALLVVGLVFFVRKSKAKV